MVVQILPMICPSMKSRLPKATWRNRIESITNPTRQEGHAAGDGQISVRGNPIRQQRAEHDGHQDHLAAQPLLGEVSQGEGEAGEEHP